MEHFNGFQNMERYFKEQNTILNNMVLREKKLEEQEYILIEQKKIQEQEYKSKSKELNKLIAKNNRSHKLLQQHELKSIKNIEKHNLKLELDNTGYIACDGHRHKSIRTYNRCNDNNLDYSNITNLVYFINTHDDNFNDKIDRLFDMFPEQERDDKPINRYNKYKQYLKKINYISEKVLEKQTKYKRILKKMRNRHNITDVYRQSESSNSDDSKSMNSSESSLSESDNNDSEPVKNKTTQKHTESTSSSDFSDDSSSDSESD